MGEVIDMSEIKKENEEVLLEHVTPEDLPHPEDQVPAFVPSPRWKRVLAWVLFAIVAAGIIFWLLGIANPNWVEQVRNWILWA